MMDTPQEDNVRASKWSSLLVAGSTLAAIVGFTTTSAGAVTTQTLTVGVGGDRVVHGVGVEGMRFDAPTLDVHQGDTITFQFRGFHTVTAIPAGTNAGDWRDAHMGLGGDYSLIQADGDDTPLAFQFNKNDILPSDPTCGSTDNPCSYDGSAVVNSGLPVGGLKTYSITVNAAAPSTFWVLCLLHGMMQLKVNVVADDAATTTQAAINSYSKSMTASDNEQAAALIPALQQPTSHRSGGHKIWDAFAGFDGDGFGLDAMFPTTLHIKKGQYVRWHFAQLTGNIHTVTFPKARAVDYADKDFAGALMKCESDSGDTTATPAPPFCGADGPAALEVELRAGAILHEGGSTYGGGSALHSSGVEGLETGNVAPYTLRFTRKSGKHGFAYACNVHGGMMSGHVIVKK